MQRSHRSKGGLTAFALVAMLAVGLVPTALGDDRAAPSQPSAIERLVRQEVARKAELARYDAIARQNDLSLTLDARERAMVARASAAATATSAAARTAPASPEDGFAWGAAGIGVLVGIGAVCFALGCVTLVRHDGRLRSA